MKVKLAAIVLLVAFVSACTQRTCPTYAKKDIKPEVNTEKVVRL